MATRNASFSAVPVKDVWTITVANTWATSDTATVTIAGLDLVVTIGSSFATTDVATAIKQAFNSESMSNSATCIPQGGGQVIGPMIAYVATVVGSTVVLTARTAGMPQTISVSESTVGSGSLSISHTTTGTGPEDWSNTDNWAEGFVPVSTDDVIINLPGSFKTGLAQSSVTLASLTLGPKFNGQIGLKSQNVDSTAYPFRENRDTELAIGATVVTNNSACTLVRINQAAVAFTATSNSTGVSAETGSPAFVIRGTDSTNVLNVYGGSNGFASNNETATVATINQDGGTLLVGTGVTLTTLNKLAGTAVINCAATTVSTRSGSLTQTNGNFTTANVNGGTAVFSGTGNLTTVNMLDGTLTVASTRGTITTLTKTAGTANVYTTVTTATNTAGSLVMTTGNMTTLTNAGTFSHSGGVTITTLNQLDGTVTLTSASSTVTTLNKTAGTAVLAGACTTSTNQSGSLTIGTGNVTATTIYDGKLVYAGTGTITAATIYGGVADIRTGDITLLSVFKGTVDVSRAGTLATLRQSGGSVRVLASATAVTTIDKSGGECDVFVAAGTVTNEGGNITLRTGNSTTITVTSGYCRYNGAGTLTTVNLYNKCTFDVDGGTSGMTITNLSWNDNVTIRNMTGRITLTNSSLPTGLLSITSS